MTGAMRLELARRLRGPLATLMYPIAAVGAPVREIDP